MLTRICKASASVLLILALGACGGGGGSGGTGNITPDGPGGPSKIFLADSLNSVVFSTANVNPSAGVFAVNRTISGSGVSALMPDIAYDTALDRLYVVNNPSTTSIALIDHASTANGIVVPTRTLSSPSFVSSIVSIYLDTVNDELYVADAVSGILVFSNISTATSPVPLGRTITITRGVSTIAPDDIFVDTTHDILYAKLHVGSGGVSDAIAVIDHASARNTPVTVTQELTFSTSISGIIGDGAANRLFVVDAPGSKVLVFDGASAASGVVVPTRTINTPTSLHRIALVPSSSTNRLYGVAADTRTVYIINNASTANSASATVPVTAITNPSVGSLTGLAVAQ